MSWKLRTSIFVWGGVGWLYGWLVMVNGSSVGVKSVPRYPTRMALVHVEGLGMYLYIYTACLKRKVLKKRCLTWKTWIFTKGTYCFERDVPFTKGPYFYHVLLKCTAAFRSRSRQLLPLRRWMPQSGREQVSQINRISTEIRCCACINSFFDPKFWCQE